MRKKQLEFKGLQRPKDAFGGELLKGNPKTKRPLDSKFATFLTLRAKRSVLLLPKNFAKIEEAITTTAAKHHVKIYKKANVGNHLHALLKLPNRDTWAKFIRELTGKIGLICKLEGGLWKFRPHTRIIRGWRKAFKIVVDYVRLNQLEADGKISRRQVRNLADLNRLLSTAGTG